MPSNCGICLEDRVESNYRLLPCSHKICTFCYPQLVKRECPYCRTPFHKEKVCNENRIEEISIHYQTNYELLEQRSYERLERRQERRRKRRERKNRQRHENIQSLNTVFEINNSEENKENIRIKQIRYKNHKKSERWNNLRNQRTHLHF